MEISRVEAVGEFPKNFLGIEYVNLKLAIFGSRIAYSCYFPPKMNLICKIELERNAESVRKVKRWPDIADITSISMFPPLTTEGRFIQLLSDFSLLQ